MIIDLSQHPHIRRILGFEEIAPYVRDKMFRAPGSTILATVTQVDDPEKKGRVKVCYDHLNPDVEGNVGEQAFESNWLQVSPPFEGLQPESLVGEKVLVQLKDGDYNQGFLYDTVSIQEPTNKLIRLPVYAKGKLPDASNMNIGCMAIEKDTPPGCHSFVVVVKKNGKYIWANSSHSIMETTPLSTMAKVAVQRASAQNTIFQSAASQVLDGSAFKSIKNKQERAILTILNQVALLAIKGAVETALQPIGAVDIGILENSFSRNQQSIEGMSTVADSVEKYAELVAGSPRQILSGVKALGNVLGGAFNDVLKITNDVKKYLGADLIKSAIAEELNFGTQIQDFFPEVIKDMPRLLGAEIKRIIPQEVFEDVTKFAEVAVGELTEIVDEIAEFGNLLEESVLQSVQILDDLVDPEGLVESFLPDDLQDLLPFPDILQEIISGATSNLSFNLQEAEGILTVLNDLNETVLTGNLTDNVLQLQTWQDAGDLKASIDWLVENTDYTLEVVGQQVTGYFPSLGFELTDKENNIWQYLR